MSWEEERGGEKNPIQTIDSGLEGFDVVALTWVPTYLRGK